MKSKGIIFKRKMAGEGPFSIVLLCLCCLLEVGILHSLCWGYERRQIETFLRKKAKMLSQFLATPFNNNPRP